MTAPASGEVATLSAALLARSLDPVVLTSAYLDRIERVGRSLGCFIATCADSALAQARSSKDRYAAGTSLGPLDGIPVALKDNIDVAGLPTTNGFGGKVEPAITDAEVVRRLRAAGAIVLGKLNMQEGALGAVNDNPHHGRACNPWDIARTPGGSSGGSGAAVAAGLCPAALGTDTGGSVRIPAAYCGVVGLKPTFGLVSTRGVAPLFWRLDHVGSLTRTVRDAALMLGTLAGYDPACTESRSMPAADFAQVAAALMKDLRIGILQSDEDVDGEVLAVFEDNLEKLRASGATIVGLKVPGYDTRKARRAAFVAVEVGAALAYGRAREQEPHRFSMDMQGYIDWGSRASAIRLLEAEREMDRMAFAVSTLWDRVDVVASPATPQTAFPFGTKVPDNQGAFCVAANISGAPAISIPAGLSANGLPVGFHLMAPPLADNRLLAIALACEAVLGAGPAPPAPFDLT